MESPVVVKVKQVETKKRKEVMLGICGGVGPAAGLLLHQLILQNTDSAGEDQGHLNVCHFSRSEDMTDRTEYLVYAASSSADATDSDSDSDSVNGDNECDNVNSVKEVENPACGMARTFAMMHAAATVGRAQLVVGVPCNTFHSQPIWDEFIRRTGGASYVQHVHMLEETVAFIERRLPSCKRVGLMSTTGTRNSRVYHDLLEPRGYTVVEIQAGPMQQELHESIYNREWGVKSTAPAVSPRSKANFHRYALHLREQGAEAIILGCTEIPFVFTGKTHIAGCLLINPMVALARAMIREADPSRLKPEERSRICAKGQNSYSVLPQSSPKACPAPPSSRQCSATSFSTAPSRVPRSNCS
ncbi:Aspartate racemase [Phytophthora citrophthora]|uniref:Aspartate racemase n=1 Tax=Phytophthora citrophthora TaxID=4793 RepID=A0AAD9GZE9_9STRA|nr:Aspartate racemase [Phytophthora citrophthora]